MDSMIGEVDSDMFRMVLNSQSADWILNTPGGEVDQGLGIYDLLKGRAKRCYCVGQVASMGIFILQAFPERISLPHTQFLVHFGSEENTSTREKKFNTIVFRQMKAILHSRVNVRSINPWFATETYFTAEQALKKGIIDEIVDKI